MDDSTTRTRPAPPSSLQDAPVADELFPPVELPALENGHPERPQSPRSAAPSSGFADARTDQDRPAVSAHPEPQPEISIGEFIEQHPGVIGGVVLGLGVILALAHAYLWGLLFLLAGVALLVFLRRSGSLKRQQIVDRWDALIDGGKGQSEQVVNDTVTGLVDREIPHIACQQVSLAPGVLKGMLGTKRPFLVVTHTHNARLKPYKMYVNVRDYGTTLQTSWYLAYQPKLWQRVRLATGSLGLDLFDEQDLRAYVTATHHSFLDAVIAVLTELGKDTSTLNRTSKGFLGIS